MEQGNFTETGFTHHIIINHEADIILKYWTDSVLITKWFLAEAHYNPPLTIGKESKYKWCWKHKDYQLNGTVTLTEEKTIKASFGTDHIEIQIVPKDQNKTEVILHHRGNHTPITSLTNSCASWVFFLTNLKAYIEHGIDLRHNEPVNDNYINI